MTMKINEAIIAEHEHIKVFLGVVSAIFKKLQNNEPVLKEHLKQLTVFMSDYVDKYHHLKEENILFKYLEKYELNGEDDLVGELFADHTLGRMFNTSLVEAIDSYTPGNQELSSEIAATLNLFGTTLTQHICREDSDLIPFAEEHLSEDQKLTIEQDFAKLNEDQVLAERQLSKLDELVVFYDINVEECKGC